MEVWNKDEYNQRIERVKSDIAAINKEYSALEKQIRIAKERQKQLSRKSGKMHDYLKTLINNRDKMFSNDEG